MSIEEYAKKVEAARRAQNKYFALRRKGLATKTEIDTARNYAMELERKLDELTAGILYPPAAEQSNLFNQ